MFERRNPFVALVPLVSRKEVLIMTNQEMRKKLDKLLEIIAEPCCEDLIPGVLLCASCLGLITVEEKEEIRSALLSHNYESR